MSVRPTSTEQQREASVTEYSLDVARGIWLSIKDMDLSLGKRTRLYRMLYKHGPANGTALILPVDHGLEHGPRDFFANPQSKDPTFELRLARDGGYSAIAFQYGLAQKYMAKFAGEVPLIVKLNGKTEIPSDERAFSGQTASVEEIVRLGAEAVGYTLYVGSPAQAEDFVQFARIRAEAERYGMPVVVWAYPRGSAIEAKGGRDSFYAIDYAARVACELGADVVKLNFPKLDDPRRQQCPPPYNDLDISIQDALSHIVKSAGRTLVLISGGAMLNDEEFLDRSRICLDAGVTGFIAGRNVWQRSLDDALKLTVDLKRLMAKYSR